MKLEETPTDGPTPRIRRKLAKQRNSCAHTRTLLAEERTLMAWVRTCVALIALGYTIHRILQALQPRVDDLGLGEHPRLTSYEVGLALVALGLTCLGLAMLQHRRARVWLRRDGANVPFSISGTAAIFVVLAGAFAVFALLFNI